MSTAVTLIRHGRTPWNIDFRLQGWQDIGLDDYGREQVRRAADRLRGEHHTRLYSSDLRRALETAEILSKELGLDVIADRGLREQKLGSWEGVPWQEILAAHGEDARAFVMDLNWRPPGGESRGEAWLRLNSALDRIASETEDSSALVVTHGGPLLLFVYNVLGIPYGTPKRFSSSNAGFTRAVHGPKGWKIVSLNDIAHLDGMTGGHDW